MLVSKILAHIGNRGRNGLFLGALAALLLTATPAAAVTITFGCIPSDPCSTVDSQMRAEATVAPGNQLSLQFFNDGPVASRIGHIFFDWDDSLALFSGINSDVGSAGVDFASGLMN